VLDGHPGYYNITVVKADGSYFCGAKPLDPQRLGGARGRPWFERAVANGGAAVGDYQMSVTTGLPAIVVAQPLVDASGRIARVLTATIAIDQLNRVVASAELPRGAAATLFDRSGTILARFPQGDRWSGKKVAEGTPLAQLVAGRRELTGETVGVDGVRRFFVFVPVPASIDTGLYLGFGIDHTTAFRDADRIFAAFLWVLGFVVVAAIGAASVAGHVFVGTPLKALKTVTARLADGDLSARTELATGIGGVGELQEALNTMASALDARQRERDRVEQELRDSEDRYRLLFARNPQPMMVFDAETLAFLEVNDAAVARYGYSRDEFLQLCITDIRPAEDVPRLLATLASRREPWDHHADGWRHRLKSGALIDVEVSSHNVTFLGRRAVLVTAQDVTDRKHAESALLERVVVTALIADVGVALNRAADLRVCLQSCAEALVAHLDAAVARIWTVDEAGSTLELVATAGDAGDCDDAVARIAIGSGGIGRIASTRRAHFTNDAIGDAEVDAQAWLSREGLRMFIGCPLVLGSRVVGVVALFGREPLSEVTMTAAASAADLVALGIGRHQAESAQRLLASIVASSDDAIVGAAADGTILSWNAGAERLFGFTAADVAGRSMSELFVDGASGELQSLLAAAREGRHVVGHETRQRRKDGTIVPVSLTLSAMAGASGEITSVSAIVRDITERHRAERSLRESEERFRLIAATVTQVFWIADVSVQTMLYISPGYERIWGRSCESLYREPKSFLDAVHPDDRAGVTRTLERQQRGLRFDHEYRIVRPDGETRHIHDRGFPIVRADGTVVEYVGVAEDITERLKAERAVVDAEERMRFALEASQIGVWEANLRTGVAYWSDTCQRMHGVAPGSFGNTFDAVLDRIDAEDRDAIRAKIDEAIRTRTDALLEYRTTWPDGSTRWITAIGRFSYDASGTPTRGAGIMSDVTERRTLEDQLRQSQKMEAIGQLAGGVAHDFNNLLTAILGFAGFIAESLPETDPRLGDVEEIRHAAERAATLTRQLLAFSRKQIFAVRVLRLGDVVGELTPMLRRLLGESIDLATIVGDRSFVKADPGQLQQVIVNLAVNAHDAMRDGGRLTIETSDVVLDELFAQRHPSVRPGPHVKLTVADTGHGMDAATQKRIFEPFFTTKPQGQGTGLGLATVYGIVKQSGGSIWVESETGRGTTFTVFLPKTDEHVEGEQGLAPEGRTRGGAETVMLIEDEMLVREFVYKVLSRHGYSVHAFADPGRAIAYAEANSAPIDLVLTDVVLPNMSGKAAVAKILEHHPESRTLFMSGYADHAIVRQGMLDAGTAFLQKPFTPAAVCKKIRDVLDAAVPVTTNS
jgi:two-component system, cell cycle sensor histidine kinase and response regulator CckA